MDNKKLPHHARQELALIDVTPREKQCILAMVEVFSAWGIAEDFSNESKTVIAETLPSLLLGRTLSGLTNDPEEWAQVTSDLWQNRRNEKAFSIDGGKTFFLMPNKNHMIPTNQSKKAN